MNVKIDGVKSKQKMERKCRFKNGKLVRFMKETGRDDKRKECKGLLLKEIERWKKQQEKLSAHVEASTTTPI
uniref:Uncharacterized protein n=1 Tax=Salix viminalis TaxID=40686 RepID=A0A6N2LIT4_SALVM